MVYSLSQQRIKYLVEFALDGDKFTNLTLSESETDMEDMSSGIAAIGEIFIQIVLNVFIFKEVVP